MLSMKKKNYVKPSMVQYELKIENHLLQTSKLYPYPIGYNGAKDSGTNLA